MNTTQLACFVEVCSTLSFSRAAEHLHLSQPTVSHQIKSLEGELGADLLVRSTRTVRPTEEGLAFLGYAQEIVELANRAKHQVAQGHIPGAHSLRIGVHDGIEARLVSSTLARLHGEDPQFDPELRLGPDSALRDMLENGTIDVVMEYRDPKGEPAGATMLRRIFDAPAVCVFGTGHPLAASAADELTIDEVIGSGRLAVTNPRTSAAAVVDMQRALVGRASADQVMMCPTIEITLTFATAGIACTLLPDIPAMHVANLSFMPVRGLAPIAVGVRVRRGRRAALLDRFIEVFSEELQREPG